MNAATGNSPVLGLRGILSKHSITWRFVTARPLGSTRNPVPRMEGKMGRCPGTLLRNFEMNPITQGLIAVKLSSSRICSLDEDCCRLS